MRRIMLATAALVLAAGGSANAQSLEERLRSQLVAVTGQLHQLQNSQAEVQAKAAAAERERDALKGRLAAVEAQLRAARRGGDAAQALERLKTEAAELAKSKDQTQAELAAAQDALAQANARAARFEGDAARERTLAEAAQASFDRCQVKNLQAVRTVRDLLNAYERVSLSDVLARKEPLTGLLRTRVENLEQGYADRIYDSRLDAASKPPSPAAQPSGKPQ